MAMEKIVPEHQGCWRLSEEFGTDQECLCQPIWAWLYGMLNGYAPGAPVAKQLLEGGLIMGGCDDQNRGFPPASGC